MLPTQTFLPQIDQKHLAVKTSQYQVLIARTAACCSSLSARQHQSEHSPPKTQTRTQQQSSQKKKEKKEKKNMTWYIFCTEIEPGETRIIKVESQAEVCNKTRLFHKQNNAIPLS